MSDILRCVSTGASRGVSVCGVIYRCAAAPRAVNGANRPFSIQRTHSWKLGVPLMKNALVYRHRYQHRDEISTCALTIFIDKISFCTYPSDVDKIINSQWLFIRWIFVVLYVVFWIHLVYSVVYTPVGHFLVSSQLFRAFRFVRWPSLITFTLEYFSATKRL